MRNLTLLILILALLSSCKKKSDFGSEWFSLKYDGDKRDYLVHVPESYDENTPTSLIIALHGGVGHPVNIEEQSQLSVLSDEEGFIVCYPKGENRTWNAGGCCGKAMKKNIDDVGFISALINQLLDDYNIRTGRVFVTGMSNGAFMSYRLACELSDQIAAIAPVAGTMNVEECDPVLPVAIIHFHSYEDSNIPAEGGVGDGISDHYNPPLDSVLTEWSAKNGCQEGRTTERDEDDYDWFTWTECSDSTEVHLYMTHDGGHSWPMGTKPRGTADDPSTALDADRLMWAFFQKHARN